MTTSKSTGGGKTISFGIVGSGWRSETFLRVASELPSRFRVAGLVTRSAQIGREIESRWGVPTFSSVEALAAATSPKFAVVSVPRAIAPDIIEQLAARQIPALTETPPGPDIDEVARLHRLVERGAVIQVAEQYHLSPLLRSQLAIAASGRLGSVSSALVAQCHDYHGVSIIRRALGVGFDNATITASTFDSPLVRGPDRSGDPTSEVTVTAHQVTARLEFGGRLGIYDFAVEQYFSWIRSNRLLIRGDRGEIDNERVSYLQDFRTPMFDSIRRVETGQGGNLEGQFLRGLIFGDQWVYKNRYAPGRLSDDELAIADCLRRMSLHVDGGPALYSLAEAAQDLYLSQLITRAAESGEPQHSATQAWAG